MTEREKRTETADNEIIKAIEICAKNSVTRHNGLTYQGMPLHFLFEDVLGFVNRQNSNIEEIKSENSNLTSDLSSARAEIEKLTVELQAMRGAANSYKREAINLELTLRGVMHSVDKWLEGDELKQNEVDRAVTMREKTLQIVERLKNLVEASDKNCKTAVGIIDKWEKQYAFAKAEAAKKFAERVNEAAENAWIDREGDFIFSDSEISTYEIFDTLAEWCKDVTDNLLKEFTEGDTK